MYPFIQMLFLKSFEVKIACQCGKFGGEVGGPGGADVLSPFSKKAAFEEWGQETPHPTQERGVVNSTHS